MSTFEKVQALFAEQFECDPATITWIRIWWRIWAPILWT